MTVFEVGGSYLVKQLPSIIVEFLMGEHTLVTIDTLPCGVEQLTGEFT